MSIIILFLLFSIALTALRAIYGKRFFIKINHAHEASESGFGKLASMLKYQLFILPTWKLNAYTVGLVNPTVFITVGLTSLSEQEIEAVLAHEEGHIIHNDILVRMTMDIVLSIVGISSWYSLYLLLFKSKEYNTMSLIFFAFISPFLMGLIKGLIIQLQEIRADRMANPGYLASALNKISHNILVRWRIKILEKKQLI